MLDCQGAVGLTGESNGGDGVAGSRPSRMHSGDLIVNNLKKCDLSRIKLLISGWVRDLAHSMRLVKDRRLRQSNSQIRESHNGEEVDDWAREIKSLLLGRPPSHPESRRAITV
jgi:hypothetical protein